MSKPPKRKLRAVQDNGKRNLPNAKPDYEPESLDDWATLDKPGIGFFGPDDWDTPEEG